MLPELENRIANCDLLAPAKYHWFRRTSWRAKMDGADSPLRSEPACRRRAVPQQEHLDSPCATSGYAPISSGTEFLFSGSGWLGFKRGEHLLDSIEGAVDATLLDIFQTFGNCPVNDCLGRKCDLALFDPRLQQVAHCYSYLF